MLSFSIVVTCLLACGKGSDAPKQEAKPTDKSVESTPKEPAPNPVIAELATVGDQLCACTDLNCINKMESKLFVTAQKTSVTMPGPLPCGKNSKGPPAQESCGITLNAARL